jgi:hypothetical protein
MAISTDPIGAMSYGPRGGIYRVVASREQTDDAFFAFEATEPPGGGPSLHIQAREEELFVVLEGSTTEYQALEQGPGGNSETGARGGLAVPDADLQPAAQVRVRTAEGGLISVTCRA